MTWRRILPNFVIQCMNVFRVHLVILIFLVFVLNFMFINIVKKRYYKYILCIYFCVLILIFLYPSCRCHECHLNHSANTARASFTLNSFRAAREDKVLPTSRLHSSKQVVCLTFFTHWTFLNKILSIWLISSFCCAPIDLLIIIFAYVYSI